jgi:hypothetical protein
MGLDKAFAFNDRLQEEFFQLLQLKKSTKGINSA